MTPIEKILYLQKAYNLNDRAFCTYFKIKYTLFKKWKNNSCDIEAHHVSYLCHFLKLDVKDFMRDNSCLEKSLLKEGDHMCIKQEINYTESEILEDFPREDNSRYEEKD